MNIIKPRFNYAFRTAESTRDIRNLVDFLAKQDLGYPNYDEWTQRCEHELFAGYKTGIMAFSDSRLVGDLIFQPHKTLPRVRELKNMRVTRELQGKYFAKFMLKQAELGLGKDFNMITCDVPEKERAIREFMVSAGYREIAIIPLYSNDARDVVMTKMAA